MDRKPNLVLIEFEYGNASNENISDQADYLVRFKNRWYGGRFEKFVFGWSFQGIYAHGCRLDMDGWQKIYKIEE